MPSRVPGILRMARVMRRLKLLAHRAVNGRRGAFQALFALSYSALGFTYAFVDSRSTSRSSVKVQEIDVAAAAYERAEKINAAAFGRLEKEVDDLRKGHTEQGDELRKVKKNTELVTQDPSIAINWHEQFLMREQDGSRHQRPHIPTALRKHIHQTLLIEQRQEQLQHNRGTADHAARYRHQRLPTREHSVAGEL